MPTPAARTVTGITCRVYRLPWQGRRVVSVDGEALQVTISVTGPMKFCPGLNHCDPRLEVRDLPRTGHSPQTRVGVYPSGSGAEGAQVRLYGIIGGGHNCPGTDSVIPPGIAAAVNLDFHASDAIWAFRDRSRPRQ